VNTWWRKADDLTDEQQEIIHLPPRGNYLITGPPGSGKTNLLLLRANYLFRGDFPNIAVLVFNRGLREFIAAGADFYTFPFEKVQTIHGWQIAALREEGIRFQENINGEQFLEKRARLAQTVRKELIETRGIRNRFDVLLLDEAHDYTQEEVANFSQLSRYVYAVADERQRIYSVSDSMKMLRQLAGTNVFHLTHHFRVGPKICGVADHIGAAFPNYEPLFGTCNYDEQAMKSEVTDHEAHSLDDEIQAVCSMLPLQLKAYPDEVIGVLAPYNDIVNKVYQQLHEAGLSDISIRFGGGEFSSFDANTRICVSTIHSAKGMEFRAVHLVGTDRLSSELQRNVAYTAVTRAKTSLTVHHSNTLPGFLDSAIRSELPPRHPVDLDELFGSKGGG